MATLPMKSVSNADRCENPGPTGCGIDGQPDHKETNSIATRIARVKTRWSKHEQLERRLIAAVIQSRLADLIFCSAR